MKCLAHDHRNCNVLHVTVPQNSHVKAWSFVIGFGVLGDNGIRIFIKEEGQEAGLYPLTISSLCDLFCHF